MHFEFVCKDTLIDGSFPYAELCANNRIFLSHFKSNYKYFHGAQICIL